MKVVRLKSVQFSVSSLNSNYSETNQVLKNPRQRSRRSVRNRAALGRRDNCLYFIRVRALAPGAVDRSGHVKVCLPSGNGGISISSRSG